MELPRPVRPPLPSPPGAEASSSRQKIWRRRHVRNVTTCSSAVPGRNRESDSVGRGSSRLSRTRTSTPATCSVSNGAYILAACSRGADVKRTRAALAAMRNTRDRPSLVLTLLRRT
eukprot:scaffold299159_cov28-Tisochrysis_lutea.AAC.1